MRKVHKVTLTRVLSSGSISCSSDTLEPIWSIGETRRKRGIFRFLVNDSNGSVENRGYKTRRLIQYLRRCVIVSWEEKVFQVETI